MLGRPERPQADLGRPTSSVIVCNPRRVAHLAPYSEASMLSAYNHSPPPGGQHRSNRLQMTDLRPNLIVKG